MKLSEYAKKHNICYRTAWNMFKENKIPGAYKLPSGAIRIGNKENIEKLDVEIIKEKLDYITNILNKLIEKKIRWRS